MNMKKLLAIFVGLSLCSGLFAQNIRERYNRELGSSPFYFHPLSYVTFGFSGMLKGDASMTGHTSFFKNPQFGFNMLEFGVKAGRFVRFSLGADINWTWYHLDKAYMFVPTDATSVAVVDKNLALVKEVKTSILTTPTFEFPLNIYFRSRRVSLQLGAALEVRTNAFCEFKGVDNLGHTINDMREGTFYSKSVKTNAIGYTLHVALCFRSMGVFAKFRPGNILADGHGPQFSTWTLGLIMGLGL